MNVLVSIPQRHLNTILETLAQDSKSAAFDKELCQEISAALRSIQVITPDRSGIELLTALEAVMKCNKELGAISRPVANEARAAIAKWKGKVNS